MFATDSTGKVLLGRFEEGSLQGLWLRSILEDRSKAIEEWHRNIRLQGLSIVDPGLFEEPPTDGRDVVTVADKLESVYRRYRFERWQLQAVMANDPDNEGRGSSLGLAQTVNATEVRGSERWQSSNLEACYPEGTDWQCYSVDPRTGSKTPFEPSKGGRKGGTSKGRSVAENRAASHRRIVAKLGIVAADSTDVG